MSGFSVSLWPVLKQDHATSLCSLDISIRHDMGQIVIITTTTIIIIIIIFVVAVIIISTKYLDRHHNLLRVHIQECNARQLCALSLKYNLSQHIILSDEDDDDDDDNDGDDDDNGDDVDNECIGDDDGDDKNDDDGDNDGVCAGLS